LVDGPGAAARFAGGSLRLAVDRSGNLFVADTGNHAIRKITPQGDVSTLLVRNVPGEELLGIAVDPAGTLYFSVATCQVSANPVACEGAVYRISPALQAVPVLAQSSSDASGTGLTYPTALTFDTAGSLYIADGLLSPCSLRRLTPSGDLTRIASACGQMVAAADGAIYVAERQTVTRIANGVASVVAGASAGPLPTYVDGPGPDARFGLLGGIAIDPHGDLYVVDAGNSTIRKIDPSGMVTTVAGKPTANLPGVGRFVPGPLPGEFDNPASVAFFGTDLYVGMWHAVAVVVDVP
jgi:streptogramin lyase